METSSRNYNKKSLDIFAVMRFVFRTFWRQKSPPKVGRRVEQTHAGDHSGKKESFQTLLNSFSGKMLCGNITVQSWPLGKYAKFIVTGTNEGQQTQDQGHWKVSFRFCDLFRCIKT